MRFERLLLDANVLLLLVVGSAARDFVGRHKRLQAYGGADFDLLRDMAGDAECVLATANAWTEVSNIVDFGVTPPLSVRLCWEVKSQIELLDEIYVPGRQVCGDYTFMALGLSDAAALLAMDDHTTLITTDAPLFEHALARGRRAINFHHEREQRGLV